MKYKGILFRSSCTFCSYGIITKLQFRRGEPRQVLIYVCTTVVRQASRDKHYCLYLPQKIK